jgi:hypothetical protein
VVASPWPVPLRLVPVVGLVARARLAPVERVPHLPVVPVDQLVVPVVPVARAAVSPVVPVARVVVPVAQRPVAIPVVRRAVRADARTRSVARPSVVALVGVVVEMSLLHQ